MENEFQTKQFLLESPFQLRGDQSTALDKLEKWIIEGHRFMTLLGVTGSGKTFTMANLIQRIQKPVLIVTHNKTLAAQLYSEFLEFFPENAIEYFVSYYDYYQPEAYLPGEDIYIEKDSDINEDIDRFRHSATTALFTRRDSLVVASVSCIYGLGSPEDYMKLHISLKVGDLFPRKKLLNDLINIQYSRNDLDFHRSHLRVRGENIDIFPVNSVKAIRIKYFGDEIERIERFDPITGELLDNLKAVEVFPAQHFVTTEEKREAALAAIEAELTERVKLFQEANKLIEAQRIQERTKYDLEMIRETGSCKGIENYSRHLSGRAPGQHPDTLVTYIPKDCLVIFDESHMTVPQMRGMHLGDRSRKQTLIDFGFRLPSAIDNRPLTFDEFLALERPILFVSATPGRWELEVSQERIAEQLIRPTGLLDPKITVVPTTGQIDHLMGKIQEHTNLGGRVLITTLTKRMAQELAKYFDDMGTSAQYLHSDIDTLERIQILHDLRLGEFKVLVGVNLLREGLDLPEVSLVAILDADKEGFLRSAWSLIQTCGRAARNVRGEVVLYADKVTEAMRFCISETERRRSYQESYNKKHGIEPASIIKSMPKLFSLPSLDETQQSKMGEANGFSGNSQEKVLCLIDELKKEMEESAKNLQFERAAMLRDEIIALKEEHLETHMLETLSKALKKGRQKGFPKKRQKRGIP